MGVEAFAGVNEAKRGFSEVRSSAWPVGFVWSSVVTCDFYVVAKWQR